MATSLAYLSYEPDPQLPLLIDSLPADCQTQVQREVHKNLQHEIDSVVPQITDPELRGKPPEKGNYKVMSVGKIRLNAEVLIDVTISADSFRDEPYQQLLGAIEGMEYKPGR